MNLYVKNIEDDIGDDRFYQEFSVYGTITSAKIMKDVKGNSKGFGFVCFSSMDEATSAINEMNGRILVTKPLYVALAQRKEERRAQLSSLMMQRTPSPFNVVYCLIIHIILQLHLSFNCTSLGESPCSRICV